MIAKHNGTRSATCSLLVLCLVSCGHPNAPTQAQRQRVDAEITGLRIEAHRCQYLRSIFDSDQFPRTAGVGPTGFASDEARVEAMSDSDRVNGYRIDRYLHTFGHPTRSTCEELAVLAPWTVLHHSNNDGLRTRWTSTLLEAYHKGDLDESAMAWFLKRSYETRFGREYNSAGATDAMVIDALAAQLSP